MGYNYDQIQTAVAFAFEVGRIYNDDKRLPDGLIKLRDTQGVREVRETLLELAWEVENVMDAVLEDPDDRLHASALKLREYPWDIHICPMILQVAFNVFGGVRHAYDIIEWVAEELIEQEKSK